jgi:hypothetical protein
MQPTRRSYSKSFKAQVIQECAQPDASIASVTLSHSLNANLPQMDSAASAKKPVAPTCIYSVSDADGRGKLPPSIIEYLR